jgi:hypothetical protein
LLTAVETGSDELDRGYDLLEAGEVEAASLAVQQALRSLSTAWVLATLGNIQSGELDAEFDRAHRLSKLLSSPPAPPGSPLGLVSSSTNRYRLEMRHSERTIPSARSSRTSPRTLP